MHLLNISKRKDLKSDIQKKNDELEEYKRILKIQKSNIIENQKNATLQTRSAASHSTWFRPELRLPYP